jgi:argininosuccinate lyase
VFEAADAITLALAATAGMIDDLSVDPDAMRAAAGAGYATATDLADWLVRKLGLPFREAHHVTGRIVRLAEEKGVALEQLPIAEMQRIEKRITREVFDVLGVDNSVASRTSLGGTSPANVRKAVAAARKRFL